MNVSTVLITCDDDDSLAEISGTANFFSFQNESGLWNSDSLLYADFLEKLVFHVSRKPKYLTAHLQRIYYCFHAQLSEQLFAAIVDFFIVLNKHGKELSWRILLGAKPQLSNENFDILQHYLDDDNASADTLLGNQHSVFTKGLFGVNNMVRPIEKEEVDDDPLALARDYIEYSQLDDAKQVLEDAIIEFPERLDIQQELLSLYKSTRDVTGFKLMIVRLTRADIAMNDEWKQLNNYFEGHNKNG